MSVSGYLSLLEVGAWFAIAAVGALVLAIIILASIAARLTRIERRITALAPQPPRFLQPPGR